MAKKFICSQCGQTFEAASMPDKCPICGADTSHLSEVKSKGINTNDFCWFGIQLFDNRWDKNDHYIGYDGAKADASGAMIYSIGSKYVYPGESLWKNGAPAPNGDWVHIELDISPYLQDMLEHGQADGYFKANTLNGLCLNGMNMGWETIGTFDHTMYVKNFALTSYPDGIG